MKNLLILFSLIFILGNVHSKDIVSPQTNGDKKTIVLINPGVFYLESIVYMTENDIIKGDNIEYLAVFYTKSEVKYTDARDYVKKNNINFIKFREVYGNLSIGNLYKTNSCTEDFKNIFQNSDGMIFLGGWDIPPVYYGQKTDLTAGVKTPNRHLFELSFLFHLLGGNQNPDFDNFLKSNPNYPVFGICLGMQTMNVATGGDMYQDIPSDIYGLKYVEDVIALGMDQMHRNYNKHLYPEKNIDNHSFHHIIITDKKLRKRYNLKDGFNPVMASSHHQAVKRLGKNMKIAGTSLDGKVVEALVHTKYKNVIGVQFHPEFKTLHDPNSIRRKFHPDDKEMLTEHEILLKNHSYEFDLSIWEDLIRSVQNNHSNKK